MSTDRSASAAGPTAHGWAFDVEAVEGRDPLADQDPTRFVPLAAERAAGHPDRRANAYPYAWEHAAQIFDHPCAPDLCVLHTAAHQQAEHRGEHGSLGVIQARAPFVLAGAGVRRRGLDRRPLPADRRGPHPAGPARRRRRAPGCGRGRPAPRERRGPAPTWPGRTATPCST